MQIGSYSCLRHSDCSIPKSTLLNTGPMQVLITFISDGRVEPRPQGKVAKLAAHFSLGGLNFYNA